MKRSLVLILTLLVVLTFPFYSHGDDFSNTTYWNSIYESDQGIIVTRASSVDQTNDGGFVVASWFSPNWRDDDGFVLKLDKYGRIEWQHAYGGNGNDVIESVKQTKYGGFIAIGMTGSFGEAKVWALKLDRKGDIVWQKAYGGRESDSLKDVVQTPEGGYILAGMTESFGASGTEGWLVKLNENGEVLWQKRYGGEYHGDEFRDIELTDDGNFVVTGEVGPSDSRTGPSDFWVLKLDDHGEVIWQKKYGGAQYDQASSIKQVPTGGFVVAGTNGSGEDDFWVIKLDAQGNVIWQRMYGGSEREAAFSIWPDGDGGYVVAGRADSFSDLRNGWILGLKSTGEIKWQRIYGGNILLSGRQLTGKGHIVVGDSFTNSNTCWIMKLDEDGEISPSCRDFHSTNISPEVTTTQPSKTDISPVDTSATQVVTQADVRTTHLTKNEICSNNKPPEAGFTFSPDNPTPDSTVTFEASDSSDPDGSIKTYKWDWDDDETYEDSLSSPTIEHSFSNPGDYPVTLKVVDNEDASDTATKTVSVEAPDVTLTLTFSGNGSGTVTVNGSEYTSGTTENFDPGTEVDLSASADQSSEFAKWTVDGTTETNSTTTVTMDEDKTVDAKFKLRQYEVTLTASPNEGGEVSGGGSYEHGTEVTVEATPAEGYNFVNWTEDANEVSTNAEYTFPIEESRDLTAHFEEQTYTLDVTTEGQGSVEIEPDKDEYTHDTEVTLTAEPDEHWHFEEWTGDYQGTDEKITVTVDEDKEITAHFNETKKFKIRFGPNPVNPEQEKAYLYYHFPPDLSSGTFKVYNAAGKEVYTASLSAGASPHKWTVVNERSEPLADGVYLYIVRVGDQKTVTGQIIVERRQP